MSFRLGEAVAAGLRRRAAEAAQHVAAALSALADDVQRFTAALVRPRAAAWVEWAAGSGLISAGAENQISQGFVQVTSSQGCD